MSLIFFFLPFFLFFFTLELKNCFFLSSFCSLLCSFLLYLVFFSNLLSFFFLFSYYSILSASPYCSITIQSVLFLLFVIFYSPLYLFSFYFALASVFFKQLLLLVRTLWYSCYLFPLSFIVSSILSLLISVLHLDLVSTLSVVLLLVSSLLYIYYSCSLSLFP